MAYDYNMNIIFFAAPTRFIRFLNAIGVKYCREVPELICVENKFLFRCDVSLQ